MFTRFCRSLRDAVPYVINWKNAKILFGAGCLVGLGAGLDIFAPLALGATYGMASSGAASATLLGIEVGPYAALAMSTTAYLISGQVLNLRNEILSPVGPEAVRYLTTDYAKKCASRSSGELNEGKFGDDMARIHKGYIAIETVASVLTTKIVPTLFDTGIAAAVISGWYGVELGVGLAAVVLISAGYNVSTTHQNVLMRDKTWDVSNASADALVRTIEHSRVIQLNNNEEIEVKRVDDTHRDWAKLEGKSARYTASIGRKQDLIIGLGYATLAVLVLRRTLAGEIGADDFVAMVALLVQVLRPVREFDEAASQLVSALADLHMVFEFLKKPSAIVDAKEARELKLADKVAEVEFKNVSLRLGENQILTKVSFVAPAGKKTVIVGGSGAGKSTVINLLNRFYDPDEGEVLVGGQNIRQCTLRSVRSIMATIPQTPDLFHESIADNIAYGRLSFSGGATREQVVEAAKKACLADFIETLPEKYETNAGRSGNQLSGGQKQRIAIARALIREPRILIGDEPTSALDNETQAQMQKELGKISDVTFILVTHDLALAEDADLILVFKKGRIVERGTHEELLQENGEYATLYQGKFSAPEEKVSASRESKSELGSRHRKSSVYESGLTIFHPDPPSPRACPQVVLEVEERIGRAISNKQ